MSSWCSSFVEVRGGQTKAYSISELKFVGLKVRCRTYPDKGLTKAQSKNPKSTTSNTK